MVKVRKKRKDKAYCETLDKLLLEPGQITDLAIHSTSPLHHSDNEYTLENNKAFRYLCITHEPEVQIGEVSMQYEYLPEEYRGNFRCNDEELNCIWEVGSIHDASYYTRVFYRRYQARPLGMEWRCHPKLSDELLSVL